MPLFLQILTLLVLIILPLFPRQLDERITYAIIGFAIVLFPVFLKNVKEDIERKNPITIFFLFFLAATLLSTMFSIDYGLSVPQLLLYCSYFVIFTSIRSIFQTLENKKLFAFSILLLTSVLSLISLYNRLFIHYVNRESEGVSFMWTYYGYDGIVMLLLFAIPINFFFLKNYWQHTILRGLLLLNLTFLLLELLFANVFASLLALTLSIGFAIFLFSRRLPYIKYTILLFLVLSILTFVWIFTLSRWAREGYPPWTQLPSSVQRRYVYVQQVMDHLVEHPLTGSGLNTFRIINRLSERETRLKTHFTHSFFVQMLSDAGILGFLSSIGLLFSTMWYAFKRVREKLRAREGLLLAMFFTGMLASFLSSMWEIDWQLPTVFLVFWIIAGLLRN